MIKQHNKVESKKGNSWRVTAIAVGQRPLVCVVRDIVYGGAFARIAGYGNEQAVQDVIDGTRCPNQ